MTLPKPAHKLFGLDFETFGSRNLPVVGLDNYLADPKFKPLVAAVYWESELGAHNIVFDFVCDPSAEEAFTEFLAHPDAKAIAHNAGFERGVLARSFPGSELKIIDSAVSSRCFGGDSRLKNAGPQLLGLPKLEVGERLIRKFSIGEDPPTAEQVSDDPDWELFKEYCSQDALVSYQLATHLQSQTNREVLYETLTHDMNQTGWPVDIPLVKEMQRRYLENQEQALKEFRQKYDPDEQLNLNSFPQLKQWCAARGIKAKSFDKDAVASMLKAIEKKIVSVTLPPEQLEKYGQVLDLLRLKQDLGGSSLKKLKVILEKVSEDGRLRDQYLHCGAAQTRRTSGVGVQMQNLKQLGQHPDNVEELKDPLIHWSNDKMADNLRQCFTASNPKGFLIVGDFSSVESRGLAYLAGEEWKLAAYRNGQDIYKVLAQKIFEIQDYSLISKSSPERKAGKVGELSCGYGAGAVAVLSMAKKLHIDMTETQANQLVADWREVNPKIVAFWAELERLLDRAFSYGEWAVSDSVIDNRYKVFVAPMGAPRSLQDQHPGVKSIMIGLQDGEARAVFERIFHGCYRRGRNLCYYKPNAVNGKLWSPTYRSPMTKQIKHYDLYGGKMAGILTQSFCRELFFRAMLEIKRKYDRENVQLIGQFHDEIVADWDPDKANLSLDETINAMKAWMSYPGEFTHFPLDAEIKYAYRYIK